ncbi:unnamed protein product, partial [Rotaria sp. Silwood1]
TFIVFREAKIEDLSQRAQIAAANQFKNLGPNQTTTNQTTNNEEQQENIFYFMEIFRLVFIG